MKKKGFCIGTLFLDAGTVLAPLAGITDLPFRRMVKGFGGCGLVISEMVSANGLVYGSHKTRELLASHPTEKPLAVQIFGSTPEIMAEAARMVQDAGADILDINFGCSVQKILKSGSGSALMKEPEKTEALIRAVRRAIDIPLTIKMRSGWTPDGKDALELGRIAEANGVDAVTLHPRTATQGFGGSIDLSLIRRLRREIRIPIIGNGDIVRPEEALHMMAETGCDAVMVGRAAMRGPHILRDIDLLARGQAGLGMELKEHFTAMRSYLEDLAGFYGEERGVKLLRSRMIRFARGIPGASVFRVGMGAAGTLDEMRGHIDSLEKTQEKHVEKGT